MTASEKIAVADLIQSAFYDGFNNYDCNESSRKTIGQAWLNSAAYRKYFQLTQEAKYDIERERVARK
jgi:hypothetical protein